MLLSAQPVWRSLKGDWLGWAYRGDPDGRALSLKEAFEQVWLGWVLFGEFSVWPISVKVNITLERRGLAWLIGRNM